MKSAPWVTDTTAAARPYRGRVHEGREFVSQRAAAAILGVSTRTVREWTNLGRLDGEVIGRRHYIALESLQAQARFSADPLAAVAFLPPPRAVAPVRHYRSRDAEVLVAGERCVAQARLAEMLGASYQLINRWVHEGRVKTRWFAGRRYVQWNSIPEQLGRRERGRGREASDAASLAGLA